MRRARVSVGKDVWLMTSINEAIEEPNGGLQLQIDGTLVRGHTVQGLSSWILFLFIFISIWNGRFAIDLLSYFPAGCCSTSIGPITNSFRLVFHSYLKAVRKKSKKKKKTQEREKSLAISFCGPIKNIQAFLVAYIFRLLLLSYRFLRSTSVIKRSDHSFLPMNDNQLFRWWGAVEKKKAKKRGRLSGILGNQNALDILSRVIHLLYKTKQPKASRRLYIFIHLYLNSNRLACVLKQSWIVNFVLKKKRNNSAWKIVSMQYK